MSHDNAELVAKVAEAICEWAEFGDRRDWRDYETPARAVLDALDLPGRERRAKAEALREFAGVLSTLARIGDNGSDLPSVKLLRAVRNDMRNRAAEIDPEEGDHE